MPLQTLTNINTPKLQTDRQRAMRLSMYLFLRMLRFLLNSGAIDSEKGTVMLLFVNARLTGKKIGFIIVLCQNARNNTQKTHMTTPARQRDV